MKRYLRIAGILSVTVLMFTLVACKGNGEKVSGNTYEATDYLVVEHLDSIKVTGRSMVCDEGLSIDWSASGIEFNADCEGTVSLTMTSTEACRFLVYVDGETRTIRLSQGTTDYTVASGLDAGEHNIRIVKMSDNAVENTPDIFTSVSKISLKGKLGEKPADKDYLVEFVGDSITCGLGTVSASSMETNATVTYAYKTAEALNVDYSFVSVSGIGIAKSSAENDGLVMSDIYSYTNYYRKQTEKYEPERKADLVVIALNTNDNGQNPTQNEYNEKATSLINQIKSVHGEDVKILWMYSMMFDAGVCDGYSADLLASLGGENAGFYQLSGTPDSSGGYSHPSVQGHELNGETLQMFIKAKKLLSGE